MHEMPPLSIAPLLREIGPHLVALLRSLAAEEWQLPTSSSARSVKDIAAHLLDGSLRRLSLQRDGFAASGSAGRAADGESLPAFLDRLNTEWERGTARLSSRVLVDLIEWSNPQLANLFESLDPHAPAMFSVAWAGETASQNWFDTAREYTEKWHHTRQIFEATHRPSTIDVRALFHPCLDTFLRALPSSFAAVDAPIGRSVEVRVTGEAGGSWFIERTTTGWRQVAELAADASGVATLPQLTAWRLMTKRRDREAAREAFPEIELSGDTELASHVLSLVAMMA